MQTPKGVIFDFNGTLFWDSELHDKTWRAFALEYLQREISDSEMKQHVHGRINRDILSFVYGKKLDAEKVEHFAFIKEEMYRKLVVSDKGLDHLAPGAVEFLNYLKEKNIPRTIATSSNKDNVDFFFEHLQLDKWFDYTKVAMEQPKMNPKPAPDIFMQAAKNINMPPENCTAIEDSLTGIQSAKNAGIGEIIFMENNSPIAYSKVEKLVNRKINSFSELI